MINYLPIVRRFLTERFAGKALRVLGESAAGRPFAGTVGAGTAARILTGGVLPEGADAARPLLRQLWRVLAPEGRMLLVAPN